MSLRQQFALPRGLLGYVAGWLMARGNRELAAWGVAVLEPASTARILEIGSGPGVALQLLAERVLEGEVIGIDPSPIMVAQAYHRLVRARAGPQVHVLRGRAEALPFGTGVIDGALTINSLPFWEEPAQGLQELHRVLRLGGWCMVVLQPRWVRTAAEVAAVAAEQTTRLRQAGFRVREPLIRPMRPMNGVLLAAEKPALS